jgi:dienelactone hydrolase
MHGIGGVSDFFFSGADIRPLADELNAIVVSPQALPEQETPPPVLNSVPAFSTFLSAAWGCGLYASATVPIIGKIDFEFNTSVADEDFIRQVIENTQAAYPAIANKNVFLLGTSMGAFMGNQYAEKYDDFGGFISIVGSRGLKITSFSATGAIPVCLFNSESDEVVFYAGSGTQTVPVLGAPLSVQISICEPIDDVVNAWKTRNGVLLTTGTTSSFPAATTGGNAAEKTVYGSGSNEVVFYKMQGVAHSHYLATANGDCLDYNTEIIAFIRNHTFSSDANMTEPDLDNLSAKAWSYGGQLHLYSPKAGKASIYTLAGQLYKHSVLSAGETVTLPLPKGMYIVRIDNRTWKVFVN